MTRNQFRDGNETRLQNYLRDTIEQALGASSVSGLSRDQSKTSLDGSLELLKHDIERVF